MLHRVATGGAAEESANIVGKAGSAESAMFMLISLDILDSSTIHLQSTTAGTGADAAAK